MNTQQITAILSCALLTLAIGCSPATDEDRDMEGDKVDVLEPAASTQSGTPKRDATTAENPKVNNAEDGLEVVVEKEVK